MSTRTYLKRIAKHPLGALYGTLLGFVALSASIPMFKSGMWDGALVDLAMAGILIMLMLQKVISFCRKQPSLPERITAWVILILADMTALLPTHNFAGSISTAISFSLLICAFVLYFSGTRMALSCIAPALWCCVFMPYHEEFMLLLSFPLRLTATVLSSTLLNLCGIHVVHSGTSLTLPGIDIAITDACSGINQLDAFILIAFVAVQLLHKKDIWKYLHFAFIFPFIIIGNSLRIVLTVLLYRVLGETVFENTWHTVLGYTQIIFALLFFIAIGLLFSHVEKKSLEERS